MRSALVFSKKCVSANHGSYERYGWGKRCVRGVRRDREEEKRRTGREEEEKRRTGREEERVYFWPAEPAMGRFRGATLKQKNHQHRQQATQIDAVLAAARAPVRRDRIP